MEYTKEAHLIGKAGELRVRSELLLRDIHCGVFDQDVGADVFLANGKLIQVKTSLRPIHDKKSYNWKYSFNLRQAKVRNKGNGLYERRYMRRNYSGVVDYFILWCVQDNVFYIIPEDKIGAKISLTISTPDKLRTYKRRGVFKSTSKYEKYKNNWKQLI